MTAAYGEESLQLSAVLMGLARSFQLVDDQLALSPDAFDFWRKRLAVQPHPELLAMQLIAMGIKLQRLAPDAADEAVLQLSELAVPLILMIPEPEPSVPHAERRRKKKKKKKKRRRS